MGKTLLSLVFGILAITFTVVLYVFFNLAAEVYNINNMNLKEQLVEIQKGKSNSEIEAYKTLILEAGKKNVKPIYLQIPQKETIEWIKEQGFTVEVAYDQREGDHIKIDW